MAAETEASNFMAEDDQRPRRRSRWHCNWENRSKETSDTGYCQICTFFIVFVGRLGYRACVRRAAMCLHEDIS